MAKSNQQALRLSAPWSGVTVRFMRRQLQLHALGLAALCLLFAGCQTLMRGGGDAADGRPWTNEEARAFLARAEDARRYGITVYDSARGPVYDGVHRTHYGQIASLPFRSSRSASAPLIPLDARTQTFLALMDTTAAQCWVHMETARALRVVPLYPVHAERPAHVRDATRGYASIVPQIRFESFYVETALLFTRGATGSLGSLARGQEAPRADLVLGTDFLTSLQFVQWNYPARTAMFSATTPYRPRERALVASVPYQLREGVVVALGAVNGAERLIAIDVAGDFEAALPGTASASVRQLSVGDLVLRNVAGIGIAQSELGFEQTPRIGRRLLQRFKVTLDNGKQVIHFERPDDSEKS